MALLGTFSLNVRQLPGPTRLQATKVPSTILPDSTCFHCLKSLP